MKVQRHGNIFLAHCVHGIPPEEIMIPYPSIRSLFESQVLRHKEKTFVVFHSSRKERSQLTYSQVYARMGQAANYLEAQDLSYGNRIALPVRNDVNALLLYFASWTVGAVCVPATYKTGTSAAADPDLSNDLEAGHEHLRRLTQQYDVSSKFLKMDEPFQDVIRHQKKEFKIGKKSKLSDDALIVFQQAADGIFRGIVLSHYNVLAGAMAISRRHKLTDGQSILCCVPLHRVTGIVGTVMAALYTGCRIVFSDPARPEDIVNLIRKEKVDLAVVDAGVLSRLLDFTQARKTGEYCSLKYFICSHRNLTTDIVARVHRRLGVRVIPGFELAEASSFSSFFPLTMSGGEYEARISAGEGLPVGSALFPVEMSVLDPSGKELPEGETGQIAVRGHTVMKEYLDDTKATDRIFKSGWLNSLQKGFYELGNSGNKYFTVISRASVG